MVWAVPMDDRKRRVLRAIVTLYGADGEPVGSGLLAEQFGHAVSSATLRNEMAALTKLGLLEQPHTSAGRVPSAKGYRYYIDNLLDTGARLPAEEKRQIDLLFREMDYDPERLAESAARALADLTGYCVVATTPKSEDLCIAHYEVMQVGRYTAAVLAVTNAGGVRTRTAKLDFALRPGDAQRLSQALNTYLTFRSAADVREEQMRTAAQSLGSAVYYPVLSAAVTLLLAVGLNAGLHRYGDLSVMALDVGQGESVALYTREQAVLVDCGSSNGYQRRSPGGRPAGEHRHPPAVGGGGDPLSRRPHQWAGGAAGPDACGAAAAAGY